MEHLAEFREDSLQKIPLTLIISLPWINETKNIFFIKEDCLIKLIKLFVNRTNSTSYNRTFQLTFAPDILIQTILYMQRSNHKQTLHLFFINLCQSFHAISQKTCHYHLTFLKA